MSTVDTRWSCPESGWVLPVCWKAPDQPEMSRAICALAGRPPASATELFANLANNLAEIGLDEFRRSRFAQLFAFHVDGE
jgi:hypothetical protein